VIVITVNVNGIRAVAHPDEGRCGVPAGDAGRQRPTRRRAPPGADRQLEKERFMAARSPTGWRR
jgi:hypothetical protein